MVTSKQKTIKISEENYNKLDNMRLVPSETFEGVIGRILKAIKDRNIKWTVKEVNGNKKTI